MLEVRFAKPLPVGARIRRQKRLDRSRIGTNGQLDCGGQKPGYGQFVSRPCSRFAGNCLCRLGRKQVGDTARLKLNQDRTYERFAKPSLKKPMSSTRFDAKLLERRFDLTIAHLRREVLKNDL